MPTIRTTVRVAEEFAVSRRNDRFGRSNSLKWPWLYDKLRAKGYDKSTAAAISNSRVHMRKKGRLNVLTAKDANTKAVIKRLAAADKAGKHATEGMLTKRKRKRATTASGMSIVDRYVELACNSKACAPPPVGKGGSIGKGGGSHIDTAGGKAHTGDMSTGTRKLSKRVKRAVLSGAPVQLPAKSGPAVATVPEFPVIRASEARGDSRPVSHEEFQRLAMAGQRQLDGFKARSAPTTGLDQNWDKVKADSYAEVTKSWGGATIDARTGQPLPQGVNKYAITIKDVGVDTVSVREGASKQEFDAAMDTAKARFASILEREGSHLGVFHDDDLKRIDIDPVLVVSNRADVDTIGAATRAIGGAYNFADGNGYWPPHVAD